MKYDEAPSWPPVYKCCSDPEISDSEFSLRPIKRDDRLRTMKWRNNQVKILEKFGYVKEECLRRHTIIDGDPIDSIMHGLLLETVQHC